MSNYLSGGDGQPSFFPNISSDIYNLPSLSLLPILMPVGNYYSPRHRSPSSGLKFLVVLFACIKKTKYYLSARSVKIGIVKKCAQNHIMELRGAGDR